MRTDYSQHQANPEVGGEQQTYLRVAEAVLRNAMGPLKVREIVERGIEQGLFGDHRLSRTPQKSMQARLSVDILTYSARSRFVRTARGRFTLRERLSRASPEVATSGFSAKEYVADRRVLRTPSEEVLCVPEPSFRNVLTFQGIDTESELILARLLRNESLAYVSRSEAENLNDTKQFVTYVLVQCGQRLLYFTRSYLSRTAEFLLGSKCIGFGGHVSAADADILSMNDHGISASARRELSEELHLVPTSQPVVTPVKSAPPNGAALPRSINPDTVRLFQAAPLELMGVLNDDSSEVGRRHVAIVYRAWLPDWNIARRLQKGESSIKGLGWIDLSRDKVDISEFEYWSQLCLRRFYPSTAIVQAGFRLSRATTLADKKVVIVAGRIGSGKTETAGYLRDRMGWPLIKSGELLQKLMGCPPLTEIGRAAFQSRAFEFISDTSGPMRLAAAIIDRARLSGSSTNIVDGIRNLSTYESLIQVLGSDVDLVFVQTPPDMAYEMYRAREAQDSLTFSYREFLTLYDAPVEAEIPSLGRLANIWVYNSFGMEAFRRTLDDLCARLLDGSRSDTHKTTDREKAKVRLRGGTP